MGHRAAGQDTSALSAPASHPAETPGDTRTRTAGHVLECAERVLDNVRIGRVQDPGTVRWAQWIVGVNGAPDTARARAQQHAEEELAWRK